MSVMRFYMYVEVMMRRLHMFVIYKPLYFCFPLCEMFCIFNCEIYLLWENPQWSQKKMHTQKIYVVYFGFTEIPLILFQL